MSPSGEDVGPGDSPPGGPPPSGSAGADHERDPGGSAGYAGPDGDGQSLDSEAALIAEELEALETEMEADRGAEEAEAASDEHSARLQRERDEYLEQLQRVQAEFQNYKRRVDSQRQEQRDQAASDLVRELLPVLDACEAAISAGHGDVEPVQRALLHALERKGLSPVADAGGEFDPNVHEAVLHEEGEGDPVVAEVMRTGYLWNGRVVRAAMVRVRG